ncbi:MAG: polyhydroxyalkanoate depolymerase [Candidatus Paracaedibacteraceae bacterium]|nr:polyhydroxyalkanoate depolymerase [Candidatus Paracaedibacteraceae bacterium]
MLLYELHEFKNAAMLPAHLWSEANGLFFNLMPLSDNLWGRFLSAGNEIVERSTRVYIKPSFHIPDTIVIENGKERVCFIEESLTLEHPFCNLLQFKRMCAGHAIGNNHPNVLIVSPLSGHHATLLRDTVTALVPDHNVWITDWKDSRLISLSEGPFALDDYAELLLIFFEYFKGNIHVIAVCQPVVPVIMAVSSLAINDSPYQPKTMTLMGGPIDARVNPGVVNKFALDHDIDWFERNILATIPHYYPGVGRHVCPGFIMLNGFMALNIERHQDASFNLFKHLVQGDLESTETHKVFYDEYRSVMDVPAEYYMESITRIFQTFDLPRGKMTFHGEYIKPESIKKTALLTIEGERDDISCPGQTYAAHNLCSSLGENKKEFYVQEHVGHYGIFNGKRWREIIKPKIAKFIRRFDD